MEAADLIVRYYVLDMVVAALLTLNIGGAWNDFDSLKTRIMVAAEVVLVVTRSFSVVVGLQVFYVTGGA